MSKGEASAKRIIVLAYFHRYGWIAAMTGLAIIMPERMLYVVGICFVLFSLWTLFGYKWKWKHIYCSFQKAHRKTMTPYAICWGQINKAEVYISSVLFLVLGIAMLIMVFLF